MNDVKYENFLPNCTDQMLSRLYTIEDALRRKGFNEALIHIGDILALVQNEIDWCHRTDPVLVQYLDFMLKLQHAVNVIQNVAPSHLREVLRETISVVQETRQEIGQRAAALPRWPAPDATVDELEKQHRAYTYGYNDDSEIT